MLDDMKHLIELTGASLLSHIGAPRLDQEPIFPTGR